MLNFVLRKCRSGGAAWIAHGSQETPKTIPLLDFERRPITGAMGISRQQSVTWNRLDEIWETFGPDRLLKRILNKASIRASIPILCAWLRRLMLTWMFAPSARHLGRL